MNPSTILMGVALLILAIPIVASPLLHAGRKSRIAVPVQDDGAHLTHAQALLALRDLEFDHQTGKIPPEDFPALRAGLVAEAAAGLQREQSAEGLRSSRIEAAVRSLRASTAVGPNCGKCGASLEPDDRFCPSCGSPTLSLCPNCSAEVLPTDRFCSGCGSALPSAAA